MKQIGLFGGSFDPIHFGHLNLAVEVWEKAGLDKILFCPANISPHKISTPPKASDRQRVDMINLALEEIEKFYLFDEEIRRGGISYTIDTLRLLKKKCRSDEEINLIIDQGVLKHFTQWKDWREIIGIVNIIIGCRSTFSRENIPRYFEEMTNKKMIITNQFEVSSTVIRDRLSRGLYCGHLIPAKVLDYIYKHSLY